MENESPPDGWMAQGAEAGGKRGRVRGTEESQGSQGSHSYICILGHHSGALVNRKLAEMVFRLWSNQFGFKP